jgi:hypothetical protein
VGGQCRWRSDGELRSADGLTRWSDSWINRIGRLTRGTTPGGVEINLPRGGVDEGSEDFEYRNLIGYHVGRIDYV